MVPLRRLSAAEGRRYVADIREVLAARVRELYPLAGASPDEVYLYEPGRGLQLVIYGSAPAIRLPHESNMGAMFVRNGALRSNRTVAVLRRMLPAVSKGPQATVKLT